MMHPRRLGLERTMKNRRQAQAPSPCPARNGTTTGTAQSFTILCGVNLDGSILDTQDAFDLPTCADICSSFHPRCDGVSYDGTKCFLKARADSGGVRPSRRLDSAVGVFPGASSNCATLGASTTQQGSNFNVMCNTIIDGFDLSQSFAPTLQDCMTQCSAASGCAALSFDATQDQGFKNCYLKTVVNNATAVAADVRVDTAMLQGAGNVAVAPVAGASPAASAAPASPGVSTIPVPAPAPAAPPATTAPLPATTSGAVFFTPPAATSPSSSGAPLFPAATTTSLITELIPSPSQASQASQGVPGLFFPSSGALSATAAPNAAAEQGTDNAGASNAWIAAPVVGSIAAIALIVISFVMLKRRRLGNRNGTSSSNSSTDSLAPRKKTIGRPTAISSLFTAWLPSAGRGGRASRGSGGTRSRMGNFSEVTGKQPASRGSMRTSVTGLVRPGLAMGGGAGPGDVEGGEKRDSGAQQGAKEAKPELRNSLNGLGQNRWS